MRISDWSSDVCSSDLNSAYGLFLAAAIRSGNPGDGDGHIRSRRAKHALGHAPGNSDGNRAEGFQHVQADLQQLHFRLVGIGHEAGFEYVRGTCDFRERRRDERSEEHQSELQSLMRISYAVFCWTK